jgi:hypothetical protein
MVTCALSLSLLPCALSSARAQDSLADRFPADAVLYLEADSRALVDGALELDLAKLLDEAQVQEFLQPVAQQLPAPVSSNGLRQLLESVPWRRCLDGRVEFALRGARIEVDGQGFELSPSQPLSARQLNRFAGLMSRLAAADAPPLEVTLALDLVARIDGGNELAACLDSAIESFGVQVRRERCKVAGREATKFSIVTGDHEPMQVGYLLREGRTHWIGGCEATLTRCLDGGSQDSLARSRGFQNFKRQASGGQPVLLAYVNVANVARIFERMIPPIVKEELDLFGISGLDSFGLASTYVEGGVRDTIALCYGGAPTGLLSLLDCTEGDFEFLRKAPAETGFYLGARVDAEAFVDKLLAVTEELFPGSAPQFERGLAEASREIGMDLRQELLPAFGDEIGLYMTRPGAGSVLPDGMLLLEVGDSEQFEKLLARLLEQARADGVQSSSIRSLPEGCKGWTIAPPGSPIQPAVALTKEFLCVSPNVLKLKESLKQFQGGSKTCALDNENFARVLKGLTGAPTADGLSLLAFADLQKLVEVGYGFTPMAAGPLQESGLPLDLGSLPETDVVARHFSGIGVAGRSDAKGLSLSFFTPTGLLTSPLLLAPLAAQVEHAPEVAGIERTESELRAVESEPEAARQGKTRTLAELFSNIEKATGATIDFPAELGDVEVTYTPRSGRLETILAELGQLAGFTFEIREVDGEKLVVVSQG